MLIIYVMTVDKYAANGGHIRYKCGKLNQFVVQFGLNGQANIIDIVWLRQCNVTVFCEFTDRFFVVNSWALVLSWWMTLVLVEARCLFKSCLVM